MLDISADEKSFVVLKAILSNRWLTPLVAGLSNRLPASIYTPNAWKCPGVVSVVTLILLGNVVTSDVGPGLYADDDDVVAVDNAAFTTLCFPLSDVLGKVDRFRAAFTRALTAVRLTFTAREGIILDLLAPAG